MIKSEDTEHLISELKLIGTHQQTSTASMSIITEAPLEEQLFKRIHTHPVWRRDQECTALRCGDTGPFHWPHLHHPIDYSYPITGLFSNTNVFWPQPLLPEAPSSVVPVRNPWNPYDKRAAVPAEPTPSSKVFPLEEAQLVDATEAKPTSERSVSARNMKIDDSLPKIWTKLSKRAYPAPKPSWDQPQPPQQTPYFAAPKFSKPEDIHSLPTEEQDTLESQAHDEAVLLAREIYESLHSKRSPEPISIDDLHPVAPDAMPGPDDPARVEPEYLPPLDIGTPMKYGGGAVVAPRDAGRLMLAGGLVAVVAGMVML